VDIDAAVIRAGSGITRLGDEPMDGFLRQGCSGENRALVCLKHGDPTGKVGGVV
jgi:hypothetical protein